MNRLVSPLTDAAATPAAEQQQQWNRWGMLKAFAFRLLTAYFVLNLFRRPSPGQVNPNKGVIPATNLYQSGSPMELFVYLSENETFHFFNDSNALFWHEPNINYGDWSAGPDKDGSFSKTGEIHCSQVRFYTS
ncbi:unnamed protein product [Trichobilharzia regenti]|nr:unnamed protein product [Trichobilharzia regenti]